jgi:hypothetical protein
VSGKLHAPAALPPGKQPPGTHWMEGLVDPRAGLEDMNKRKFLILPGLDLRPLGRPAHSQSLYRLLYPGFSWGRVNEKCYYPKMLEPRQSFQLSTSKLNVTALQFDPLMNMGLCCNATSPINQCAETLISCIRFRQSFKSVVKPVLFSLKPLTTVLAHSSPQMILCTPEPLIHISIQNEHFRAIRSTTTTGPHRKV